MGSTCHAFRGAVFAGPPELRGLFQAPLDAPHHARADEVHLATQRQGLEWQMRLVLDDV